MPFFHCTLHIFCVIPILHRENSRVLLQVKEVSDHLHMLGLLVFFYLTGEANRLYWSGRQHCQMGAGLQLETLRHTG